MPWGMLIAGLLSYLSHTAQAHMPRTGTTYRGLVPPALTFNQEISPTDRPTGQFDGGSFSTDVCSFQKCQVDNEV